MTQETISFPFNVNPVHVGVYGVLHNGGVTHYSKWDGEKWCFTSDDKKEASRQVRESIGIYDGDYSVWFGLAVKPK